MDFWISSAAESLKLLLNGLFQSASVLTGVMCWKEFVTFSLSEFLC